MAAFEFKFETVLSHRKIVEEQRQRDLALLLRQKMILEHQLRSMQQTISADKREMAGSLVGSVDVRRIRQHAAHSNQVAISARQIVVKLMLLHKQIDAARAALLDAAKARKAIEKLREKQHNRWRTDAARREAAALDEISTQAFSRALREVAP